MNMNPKQISKKFIVTCPHCQTQEEQIYKLNLGKMNALEFVCSKCGKITFTGPFFLPEDYDSKKKIDERYEAIYGKKPKQSLLKRLNLTMPRISARGFKRNSQ